MAWNDDCTTILLMVILTFLMVFAGIMGAVLLFRHKQSGRPWPFQSRKAAFLPAGLFPLVAFYVLFHMFFTSPGVYGPGSTVSPLYAPFQLVGKIICGSLFFIILYIVVIMGLFRHRKEKPR